MHLSELWKDGERRRTTRVLRLCSISSPDTRGWVPGRRPSGHEAAAFVLEAPSGVSRALHAELVDGAGCYSAQVVLAEVRACKAAWAASPV